jgi:hypothetical protein
MLIRDIGMMKFCRAIGRVKWLSSEKTNVSKTISEDSRRENNKSQGYRSLILTVETQYIRLQFEKGCEGTS